jgi:UDP-glucose 4-epimerase
MLLVVLGPTKSQDSMKQHYAVVGGAGFIGSHFARALLNLNHDVTVIDNFCSGTENHLEDFRNHSNFKLVTLDVENTDELTRVFRNVHVVIHLASNPDIARAAVEPRIDFVQGTVLTESVIEACRRSDVKTILYASGSGVYGDAGKNLLTEDSALRPISTYGASKLAGETLLAAYSFMFGIKSIAFRFANVVGPKQTHGVAFDFLSKLRSNSSVLNILGNGEQSKSYIHVDDVISGVLLADSRISSGFNVFNLSTDDQITVNEIAELCARAMNLRSENVRHVYSGGDRGWKGDVPIVRISANKIKELGWTPTFNSLEAMNKSIRSMLHGES